MCQPRAEPRLCTRRANQSLRGSNHCPWTFARHLNGELVPLGHGSGMTVPGGTAMLGHRTSEIAPAAEAGEGRSLSQLSRECCPQRQLMAWLAANV